MNSLYTIDEPLPYLACYATQHKRSNTSVELEILRNKKKEKKKKKEHYPWGTVTTIQQLIHLIVFCWNVLFFGGKIRVDSHV